MIKIPGKTLRGIKYESFLHSIILNENLLLKIFQIIWNKNNCHNVYAKKHLSVRYFLKRRLRKTLWTIQVTTIEYAIVVQQSFVAFVAVIIFAKYISQQNTFSLRLLLCITYRMHCYITHILLPLSLPINCFEGSKR